MGLKIQKVIDAFWDKTLFRFLPQKVTPNFFTSLRLVSVPVALYFLASQRFIVALLLFVFAALGDSIDGALARRRQLTSYWGRILDPIADRSLTMMFFLFLLFFYPFTALLLTAVAVDLLAVVSVFLLSFLAPQKPVPGANWRGKTRMFLQVIAALVILLFFIFYSSWLLWFSASLLLAEIVFNIVNAIDYWRIMGK